MDNHIHSLKSNLRRKAVKSVFNLLQDVENADQIDDAVHDVDSSAAGLCAPDNTGSTDLPSGLRPIPTCSPASSQLVSQFGRLTNDYQNTMQVAVQTRSPDAQPTDITGPTDLPSGLQPVPTYSPVSSQPVSCQSSGQAGFQNTMQVAVQSPDAQPSAFEREILLQVNTIRETQLLILMQLQQLSNTGVSGAAPDPREFRLPLKTPEDLKHLEQILQTEEKKKNLTVLLGTVGGMSLKDTIWRILKRTIDTSLAKRTNWSGANQKVAFKGLLLKNGIVDAVRSNTLTQAATDKEMEILIIRWLQLAADRDGGRSQRARSRARAHIVNSLKCKSKSIFCLLIVSILIVLC
ncbi:uncharacterized protein LOC132866422 [Neoarius graeffei]|uniref:uncharacterized protein LOC132866422 n=1 Tax=Neoarius graeffei TaxID=443677 RepID=UPI00298C78D0|nr:uncharacterized protein LOC132866422 [Neoarius graeffei]XP_060755167.1 uncharacterized protein LOC132866422 [Neoarius graeffei]